ncbi:hypothetical protein BV25DRAFT_1921960 [Artomyces pyxidatus]|uniref:Uncharacterized protein n=1 Tax=Artomyces pyxidatus TaxID=48021 RepID=A0ACB8SFA6_9AGAM|nr:hypothetical protein BV25DRAFT_1921960 [Artomyces pyxidatus]
MSNEVALQEQARGSAGNTSPPVPQVEVSDNDPSGRIWSLYLSHAEKYDKALSESWKGDTGGILVFTGLFSAIVSAFLLESYKNLQPDSGDATVQLLTQISLQLAAISNGTHLPSSPQLVQPAFRVSSTALRVNIAWVLSLALSLICALAATLMQQWTRKYMQAVSRHNISALDDRARIRTFFAEGVEKFGMSHAVEAIPALIHLAVFLFFVGLVDFMFSNNGLVGCVTLAFAICGAVAYIALTIIPIISHNSPYQTPLSIVLWTIFQRSLFLYRWCIQTSADVALALQEKTPEHRRLYKLLDWWSSFEADIHACHKSLAAGMRRTREDSAGTAHFTLDSRALAWTLASLDAPQELEAFVAGMPAFARSRVGRAPHILVDVMLARAHLRPCIRTLLPTDATLQALVPAPIRHRRVAASVRALWLLAHALGTGDVQHDFSADTRRGMLHTLTSEVHWYGLRVYPTARFADAEFDELEARVKLTKQCTLALLNRLRIHGVQDGLLQPDEAAPLARDMGTELRQFRSSLHDGCTAQLINVSVFVQRSLPRIQGTRNLRPDADQCYEMIINTLHVLAADFQNPVRVSDAARDAFIKLWRDAQIAVDGPSEAVAASAQDGPSINGDSSGPLWKVFSGLLEKVAQSLSKREGPVRGRQVPDALPLYAEALPSTQN